MIKIAVWGFAGYGRRMLESIMRFCSDTYQITAVYDRKYELINTQNNEPGSIFVRDPEDLVTDYQQGVFEALLICMVNGYEKATVYAQENNIPITHLGSEEDLYPLSAFEHTEDPYHISQDHYEVHVLKNMRYAIPNYYIIDIGYLFDRDGKVIKDPLTVYPLPIYIRHFADFPFPFKNPKAEVIPMSGQYCVLTKANCSNYWHFTYENMDCVWLLEENGYTGKYVINNVPYCKEIMRIAGISPDRILTIHDFDYNKIYEFEELFYVKLIDNSRYHSSFVLKRLADHIKSTLPRDPSLPKKIYVKRITTRKLLGADELIKSYGFTEIIPENYSVLEQMTLFYNADVVFSVHGANSTNGLYMRENTFFVEAYSTRWENACNIYTMYQNKVHYYPVTSMELFTENPDGQGHDIVIPRTLLRLTLRNVFELYDKIESSIV